MCSTKCKFSIFLFNLLQDLKYGSEGLYSQSLPLYVVILGLTGQRRPVYSYPILTGSVVATPGIGGSSVGRGCV